MFPASILPRGWPRQPFFLLEVRIGHTHGFSQKRLYLFATVIYIPIMKKIQRQARGTHSSDMEAATIGKHTKKGANRGERQANGKKTDEENTF
jgi:hypothetical protein